MLTAIFRRCSNLFGGRRSPAKTGVHVAHPRLGVCFYFIAKESDMMSRYTMLAMVALVFLMASGPAFAQTDYDTDNDNLIDITTLEQLNAIRWDLNGDGAIDASASTADTAAYNAAFSGRDTATATRMGCAATCTGYELMGNLDFDENNDDQITSADATYWNSGAGWTPIGVASTGASTLFTATFDGNDNTISNLFIADSTSTVTGGGFVGLFGDVNGTIRDVGLLDVNVTNTRTSTTSSNNFGRTGALAGRLSSGGTVRGSYVAGGSVAHNNSSASTGYLGCLLGYSYGVVRDSYATCNVAGTNSNSLTIGGLIGEAAGSVDSTYATGTVTSTGSGTITIIAGGLIGSTSGRVSVSYATGNVTGTGTSRVGGLIGFMLGPSYANYATGNVSGSGTGTGATEALSLKVGGLIGEINLGSGEYLRSSYATGNVSGSGTGVKAGGLIGRATVNTANSISAVYAIGAVSNTSTGTTAAGGLAAQQSGTANPMTNSYWDTQTTGQSTTAGTTTSTTGAQTTSALQSPTGYTGSIYANWNQNLDGQTGNDDPWYFGATNRYPVLKYAGLDTTAQLALQPPGQPEVAVTSNTDSLNVYWRAASRATGYTVQWKSGMQSYDTMREATTTDTLHKILSLTSGTTYTVRVLATKTGVRDAPSAEVMGVPGTPSYDSDTDGLIEVSSLAQLNAMRWDLNGDGAIDAGASTSDTTAYNTAFSNRDTATATPMGCFLRCTGYELLSDLDFDTDSDSDVDSDDTYPSWTPIPTYTAAFNGNGHTITRMTITNYAGSTGLFTALSGSIREVGMINARVSGGANPNDALAILVGQINSIGSVTASYVQGGSVSTIINGTHVGGLAGNNFGTITEAYATASVDGGTYTSLYLGGLVGNHTAIMGNPVSGRITAAYAAGDVSGTADATNFIGGFVGSVANAGSMMSYTYCDSTVHRTTLPCVGSQSGSSVTVAGKTTAELQTPLGYTGIYASWNPTNDDPWAFGATNQYPALKYAGKDPAVQFNLQPVVVTLALTPSSISENGGMSTVTATLSRSLSSSATTITVRPVAGAYTVPADSTITIAAGSTANASDTVVITAVNNTQDEPNRTVTMTVVMHNSQVSGRVTGATLTLEDDDLAPMVTLTPNPASISENAAASTVMASLSRPSSEATTITVRPVAGAYTVAATDTTITIAAGDTINASDTVVITSVDNTRDEINRTVDLSGVSRNAQGAGSVTGTITLTDDDDPPTVTMVVSPASIAENGGISTVTARLSHTSSDPTTITVTVAPVSPAAMTDYTISTATTLTVAAGQTTSTGTVTITGVNNADATGNKTVTVSSTVGNNVGAGTVTFATLTLVDDDVPQVTLVLTPASITENAQVSTITATLDRTATAAATVTVSATAVAPAVAGDFTLSTATTLTFAANATTSTGAVTITSVNDTTDAPDKSVTVSATVTGGNMASLSSPETLTITDDEAAPTVTLTSNPASISENGAVSTVTATLSHKSSAITTITVRPVAGAYTVGADSTIIIAAGSTANASDNVVITAMNNTRDEPTRNVTMSVVARNTQGTASIIGGTALTLTDDDDPPDATLSASPLSFSENGGVAMVSATLSHTSSAATTITVTAVTNVYTVGSDNTIVIAADATTSTGAVTITGVDNDIDAADNTVTVTGAMTNGQGTGTVTGVSVTITDDDAPPMLSISSPSAVEGTTLTFTVRLNKASGKQVTVAYADAGTGTATSGTDYTALTAGNLTFAASTTEQTFDVTVTDDSAVDPNETVVVTLSSAVNATLNGGATSLTGTGTIIDNDGSSALSIGSPSVIEGATGATLTFRVYLIPAHTAAVTVTYADAGTGSATSGTDYTAFAAGTLTFAIGATTQTFAVSVLDDTMDEPNETVAVSLSSSLGGVTGMGRIIDDDAAVLRIDSPSVAEGAAGTSPTLRFTVSLSSASGLQVTVAYADAGTGTATSGTDYDALTAGTLTFAVGETSKTIDISVIGDAAVEPDETVVVTLSNPVSAAVAVASGTGTITNDDQVPTPTDPTDPEPEPDPDTDPSFTEAVDPQSYRQNQAIDPLTLPAATDGNGDLTYTLTGLPDGLSFDAETRTVSGTPIEAIEKAIYTLTATDEDGDEGTMSFFLTIIGNVAPSFGDASVDTLAYTRKQEITSLTLPQATGGDDPLTYALTPDLPEGLSFNAETRVLSGTPIKAIAKTTYTLTATDSDGDAATLMFAIAVTTDPIPTFGDTTVAAQVYVQHREIASLTLPQATGGNDPLTYALTPALPEGLTFDAETLTVSGTPIKAMDETTYTLTATDGNGDSAHLMFTLAVPNLVPTFGDTTIAAQSYLVNQEIASLTLPQATGGDGMLVYILLPFLPDGLSFDPTTRTLSGMPTEAKAQATYTLSALDVDGDVASLPFTLEVSLPSPDLDGDGNVNFADFLTFASKFGSRLGQERYDARCDLNGDGQIDFDDFLIFADSFGSSG